MENILRMEHITKKFPGVVALDDVTLSLDEGEVHAIAGENGAGKSTLMKILSGIYQADGGRILINGQEVHLQNPIDAMHQGIAIIHQELMPIPQMMIAENIFLGREPLLPHTTVIDRKKLYRDTEELFRIINVDLNPRTKMQNLSTAETQMIEIAKAISYHPRILIMDEPTSSLSDKEVNKLFEIIKTLKAQGVTIVYISHRMEEVYSIADRISVFRDGKMVGTRRLDEVNNEMIVSMMVGRELEHLYPVKASKVSTQIGLEVRNLSDGQTFENVSFVANKGEILGVAGLVGAGRTEVMETLFGVRKKTCGEVLVDGKAIVCSHPKQAIKNGIALVPEDRKLTGLNLLESVRFNMVFASIWKICKFGVIQRKKEIAVTKEKIERLNVKTPTQKVCVNALSGGNQQKIVIGKWLLTDPDIIILDEPTRGIDVAAKAEIHSLMRELAEENKTVIMISSELPEIVGMSDRVMVMAEGKKTGELTGEEINQNRIMALASNL